MGGCSLGSLYLFLNLGGIGYDESNESGYGSGIRGVCIAS